MTMGWAIALSWAIRRWLRQRLAWQWWQRQQALQSHHKAESIRDGLLQQTFAFRRYLETAAERPAGTALPAQPERDRTAHWLAQFQTFHQSLEDLSNELSSPFVADSLPLALQFALKDWARSHPNLSLQLALPADWPQPSLNQNQAILAVTAELLKLLPTHSAEQLQVGLASEPPQHTLTFELTGEDVSAIQTAIAQPEIQHLKEIFHSLIAGRLEIDKVSNGLIVRLCWRE